MNTSELSCRCGQVRGRVERVSPRNVNRLLCYCDDCQAFAQQLGRADLLDAHGATEIVQVAPDAVTLEATEHISGLRLTPAGLYRWHTTCCNTPLGNTLRPNVPFVGISVSTFTTTPAERDAVFGALRGALRRKWAIGTPAPMSPLKNASMTLHLMRLMASWKIGHGAPNPFFAESPERPRYPIKVLERAERDALRPLCGPNPTSRATSDHA